MIGVLIFQPTNVSSRSRIVTLDNHFVPPCAGLLNQLVVRIERRSKATCRCARVVVMVKHNFMEWGHNKDLTIVVPRLENREGWSLYLKYKTLLQLIPTPLPRQIEPENSSEGRSGKNDQGGHERRHIARKPIGNIGYRKTYSLSF